MKRPKSSDSKSARLVGIVYNPDKELAKRERTRITQWLSERGYQMIVSERVTTAMAKASLVLALGGDGTVLRVARGMAPYNVPVLGINIGRLGFLAATGTGASIRTLARVLAGKVELQERTLLSVTASSNGRDEGTLLALNDCVLRSGSTGRIAMLKVEVDKKPLATYRGDGLIVATPTGSTAYNLAASGPIVHPSLNVLLLTPICPHTLVQRPLIIPAQSTISIVIPYSEPQVMLCLDGQVTFPLKKNDRVTVKLAPETVRFYHDPERTYYQLLQTKLKWGEA